MNDTVCRLILRYAISKEALIKSARAGRKSFSSDKRMENRGILCVFPVFHSAWMAKKIRCPAEGDLFRVSQELLNIIGSYIFDLTAIETIFQNAECVFVVFLRGRQISSIV